jgi:CO dehydrogenase maturation factor
VNNVLRNIVAKLIKDYDYVIVDNEAGLEHLSRRTTGSADALVVVSDATPQGLRAAGRISELVRELDIKTKKEYLIINRLNADIEKEKIKGLRLQYLGSLPNDHKIQKISLNGGSMLALEEDAASLEALRSWGGKIWQHN